MQHGITFYGQRHSGMQCGHAKGDRRWQGIRTATARRLRRYAPVCYKRYMRKWMRERMTRRKKGDGSTPKEQANAPVPLQPKYFEASEPVPEPPAAVSQADGGPEPAPQPETERQPSASTSEGRPAERPSRRRRGRGGRGRGGARPKPGAAAVAPATAAEPSAAEPVVAVPTGKAPAAPPQASKGIVVLAIGLPGSGKSSWFKRHNTRPHSSDMF